MSRFVLAGAGPGLLSKESIELMRRYETIGVNTTVKYPEIRPLLNHWITCDGRMVTPGNDHYIGDFIADGEFDKYVLWAKQWSDYGKDIHRLKWFKNSRQAPFGGYPDKPLTLGFNNTVMTGAVSLAKHLGATECILVGSDYIGVNKADGSLSDDDMKVAMKYAEEAFKDSGLKVYKTNPKSALSLEVFVEN